MSSEKIISFADAPRVFRELRAKGKSIVQCHGTFDLIHPGHIYHLEEAKELGDVLVVTITAEKFVNKGPGRPYFNDPLRVRSLAALACVDYVVLVPHAAAVEAIAAVSPNIYCKGREYENAESDVTGNIRDDVAEVERHGGQVRYIGS
ncbi:MAG TPA: adenylyltransferase/cytidyltransferase family protein, partial [Opitutales bacterium]|nr:adenylyltransferase/cytidyltransferase family protein [Opitutales bacterium]